MKMDFEAYARDVPYFSDPPALPRLLTRALVDARGTYLEIGAGDGNLVKRLHAEGLLQNFDRIIASDISALRIERLIGRDLGIDTLTADAATIPLEATSVDFIVSDQVIEHVADDRAMAAEVYRLLSPGASAVIGSVLKLRGAWYVYRCNGRWALDPTHVREYGSTDEYRRVFTDAGLQCVDVMVAPIAYRLTDLALRIALRFAGPFRGALLYGYGRSQIRKRLDGLRFLIPRYRLIYALLRKPA